jgi:hypothetical protein
VLTDLVGVVFWLACLSYLGMPPALAQPSHIPAYVPCQAVGRIEKYIDDHEHEFELRDVVQRQQFIALRASLDRYRSQCDYPVPLPGVGIGEDLSDLEEAIAQEKSRTIDERTVEQMRELSKIAPLEFRSAAFICVADYELCRNYYMERRETFAAGFGCGVSYLVCVGQQLVPFAGK